jgi:hypothetical protein
MSTNKEIKKKETTFIRPTRKMLRVKENQCREKQETSNRKKKVIEKRKETKKDRGMDVRRWEGKTTEEVDEYKCLGT